MEMEQIIRLIKEVSNSNLRRFKYIKDNLSVELSKDIIHANETYEGLPSKIHLRDEEDVNKMEDKKKDKKKELENSNNFIIKSPIVGTFYSSPSQEGAPYVEVGDTVKKGQVVAIVEAMKIMNEIESSVDGVVEEILVKDQDVVEFGQSLFVIKIDN